MNHTRKATRLLRKRGWPCAPQPRQEEPTGKLIVFSKCVGYSSIVLQFNTKRTLRAGLSSPVPIWRVKVCCAKQMFGANARSPRFARCWGWADVEFGETETSREDHWRQGTDENGPRVQVADFLQVCLDLQIRTKTHRMRGALRKGRGQPR